ncbi:hypothetical protein OC842_003885 [Tilletia horrida]|uniref:Uncharacterized protein n=1 Tax=Tilletia horrida TaxID=155126 RepID=A0AAN6JQT1_9BASI|nr:hypothetical protein OC842_003885 [Tilletia horrida]
MIGSTPELMNSIVQLTERLQQLQAQSEAGMTSNDTIHQVKSSIDQLRKTVKEGHDATMSRFKTGQGCLDELRETQAAILDRLDDIKNTQVAT